MIPQQRILFQFTFFAVFCLLCSACNPTTSVQRSNKKVLFYQNAAAGAPNKDYLQHLQTLAIEGHFQLDTTSRRSRLTEDYLTDYSTLICYGLQPDSLSPLQSSSLERYVQAGNGLILAASKQASPYVWHWWTQLATSQEDPQLNNAAFHGWTQGQGRVILQDSTYTAALSQADLQAAIDFAIDNNSYDFQMVTSPLGPAFNRFTRKILDDDIYEPMELAVLPDLDVLFIERRGKLKRFNRARNRTELVAEFDVCTAGNYEDGLTGMALDPAYGRSNDYLYIYYSPPCDNPNQYLSRFIYKNDSLHWASEKVILKVKVQRESCCHSAGSIVFGPTGLLYLSTGDNTISFQSDGFSPIDERPGHYTNDAQKSSANTHDLRGKILRIQLEEDGTYSIPDGNLFAKDGSEGRPEIYVMGCRNPFRYTVDPKTEYVYWGDVGPDGSEPGKYGPNAHDEFNQAKAPGNFGWPHFVGDNKAYNDRDFATGEAGAPFDPAAPLNDSPNNTGSKILPPAQPAMIWYTYGPSEEFPTLGAGGRCAMVGPFYNNEDLYLGSSSSFPEYYHGKLFIYEWVRNWIKVLSFDENQELVQIESFMPDSKIYGPIEMEFGPEGAMYTLEYGNGYFLNNPQAKLVRTEYASGNRAPLPQIAADQVYGAAPLTVTFSAAQSRDFDVADSLQFAWYFDQDQQLDATGEEVQFTFDEPGVHAVRMRATDQAGASSETLTNIQVGNSPPVIALQCNNNQSFFFPGKGVDYTSSISDVEDQKSGGIEPLNAAVSLAYVSDPDFVKGVINGTQKLPDGSLRYVAGKRLINASDCRTCHLDDKKSAGPAYLDVAKKYGNDYVIVPELAAKIINGGAGVWGEERMSAHPQLTEEEAAEMVQYILSLDDVAPSLPLAGSIRFKEHESLTGAYFLTTAYQDKGAGAIAPIQERALLTFRSPRLQIEDYPRGDHIWQNTFGDSRQFTAYAIGDSSFSKIEHIDLSGIRKIHFRLDSEKGGTIRLRLGQLDGPIVGNLKVPTRPEKSDWSTYTMPINATSGFHDLFFEYLPPLADQRKIGLFKVDWVEFDLGH